MLKSSSIKRRKSAFVKVRDRSFEISLLSAHKPCKNKVFKNADKLKYRRITKEENFISLYEENKASVVHIVEDN